MVDMNGVDIPPMQKVSKKLRLAAVALAVIGAGSAVWLALEGQKVRMQQALFAERQARFEILGVEIAATEARLKSRTADLAVLQADLAQVAHERDAASATLAKAVVDRNKAEADRASAI